MKREVICIVCPNSCRIMAEYNEEEIKEIYGAQCKKGEEFVENEIKNPLRIFTGSIRCKNGEYQLVSVKTNKPIAKKYLKELAKMTHSIEVEAPIEIGQVIVPNIIENGIDLIATRRVKSKRIKDNRQKKVNESWR